jgi:hypothetical protein
MSGDYSRNTFDPLRDFSAVLMQQGRVQLDADWNELIEILDRRLRAETIDIIGCGTVPKGTPNGFAIGIDAGSGNLTIGCGRIYVDGLLAENHRNAPLEFDAVLGEQRGTAAVPYNEQPYFPNAATVGPALTGDGPHLVYLDVWQREVTYLEYLGAAPNFVEKAVGVDTTTRLQTVWQVRTLPNIGANASCDTPDDQVTGWPDVIRPSDARLSTDAVGVATSHDPCVIPPSGGYRGLENRLYRVEIHDDGAGGPNGTATFKWSRDNASIATSVTAIPAPNQLSVALIGRDKTLRFSIGDWIEITDDWREFAHNPGLMCQIQDVVDATQTVTLTTATELPADAFGRDNQGNIDVTRHVRIKLWNQQGKVGVIPVPPQGTSIILEDGVQITFDTPDKIEYPPGSGTQTPGTYHVGDFWCFAARTADASVEKLVEAPPRGIHHHYCRLAIVTVSDTVADCRQLWPPQCEDPGLHVVGLQLAADAAPLLNDTEVPVDQFAKGLQVVCDADVEPGTVIDRPTCYVTLEIPISTLSSAFIGFQPLVLLGNTLVDGKSITWTPNEAVYNWLLQLFQQMRKLERGSRVLARLTLKGNFIWQKDAPDMFLDGELFGSRANTGVNVPTDVRFPSGDRRRGGPLEMWFYLVPPKPVPPPLRVARVDFLNITRQKQLKVIGSIQYQPGPASLPPLFQTDNINAMDIRFTVAITQDVVRLVRISSNGAQVPGKVTVLSNKVVTRFTSEQSLKAGSYQLTVAGKVTSSGGAKLDGNFDGNPPTDFVQPFMVMPAPG